MVEFKSLSKRGNISLIGGATQYWTDLETLGDPSLVNRIALPHVAGRTLIVGPTSRAMREAVCDVADETQFLIRGEADAEQLARNLPDQRIWCGDVASLPEEAGAFDTILVLCDVSQVASLELEARPWATVVDQLRARIHPDGTLVLLIENDLGLHRVNGSTNPRVANSDQDWDPMATWDTTRPRTLDQALGAIPDSEAMAVWPSLRYPKAVVRATVERHLAEAWAFAGATLTNEGPDPAYLLDAAHGADRVNDFAAAWLVISRPRRALPVAIINPTEYLQWNEAPAVGGRSLISEFHNRAASSDLPGVRALVSAWSKAVAEGDFDPDFTLSLVDEAGTVHPLRPSDGGKADRWQALASVAAICRDRAWRTPWPATDDAAAILRQLGAMADLPTISHEDAVRLLPPAAPPGVDAPTQQLLATVAANERELHTMRSKLRWVELQLEQANQRLAAGTVKGYADGATRKARNFIKSTGNRVLREIGLR